MIKLKSKKDNKEISLVSQSPFCLYYAFVLLLGGIFLSFVGGGLLLIRISLLLLIIGAIKSKNDKNFNEFYKIPLIILIIEMILGIVFILVEKSSLGQGIIFSNIYISSEAIIVIFAVSKICLVISRVLSMLYNIITGRKREIIKYLKEGYEINNKNELNVAEIKLINKIDK